MTAIDAGHGHAEHDGDGSSSGIASGAGSGKGRPLWQTRGFATHYPNADEEFDACKMGMWLFLTTEILLFAGIFVAYAIFRMLYPESFAAGSNSLDWRWGGLNTVILLLSSFTVVMAVRNAQLNQQLWLKINLIITLLCALAFLVIKFTFEYYPKWVIDGKRPGRLFDYPGATESHEHLWWGIYYAGTAIHALHVVIGGALLAWVLYRAHRHKAYGPGHYTMVETAGLYWHLVDVIWIFLFPLLYLIH